MKNIFTYGFVFLLVLACKKSDNSIDKVLENYGQGAVLRTIDQSGEFNYYAISSSSFTATIEAHYKEDGGLMQNVEIFVSADGGTEAKLRTLMPSDFQVGPTGLPRATFTVTLAEVQNTISFSVWRNVAIRLQHNLTDGLSFTAKDAASSLTGSYFASPYQYNLIVGCFVTDGSAIPGKYTMNMVDSYGDSWNGAKLVVVVDGVTSEYTLADGASGSFTHTITSGSTMSFSFASGDYDEEVTY